jgi:glutamate-1-semialdehyde 2,1-aminomutase
MTIPGFTSTGSKRPTALFGPGDDPDLPIRMTGSRGARIRDEAGREYLDLVMALGAVTLGYAHPEVTAAAAAAIDRGGVGSLAPVEEEALAARLRELLPWCERIRFLKTGAEAVAAAVRLARVHTGRSRVLGCGYHGWLDLAGDGPGIPAPVAELYRPIPFNDVERTSRLIREVGNELAVVLVEPVVEAAPSLEWLAALRNETSRVGAVLAFDEIKTGFRVAMGGAVERWARPAAPDLVVYGKGLGNGFPLAAVGGRAEIMEQVSRTWISSTLATEFVSLAAAGAALTVAGRDRFPDHAARVGHRLLVGLENLASRYPDLVTAAFGIPEMCALRFRDEATGGSIARAMARRGVLFKRTGYNFVSLAHRDAEVAQALDALGEALAEARR